MRALYDFFWHDYCDWYVEIVKDRLKAGGETGIECRRMLVFVLDRLLRLLHPFVPFGTEWIWQTLYQGTAEKAPLIAAAWPRAEEIPGDDAAEVEMALVQDIIRSVRNVRNKNSIGRADPLAVAVKTADGRSLAAIEKHRDFLTRMACISGMTAGPDLAKPANAAVEVVETMEVFVILESTRNTEAERARLLKELERTQAAEKVCRERLESPAFRDKAKPEIVEREKARHQEMLIKIEKLQKSVAGN